MLRIAYSSLIRTWRRKSNCATDSLQEPNPSLAQEKRDCCLSTLAWCIAGQCVAVYVVLVLVVLAMELKWWPVRMSNVHRESIETGSARIKGPALLESPFAVRM